MSNNKVKSSVENGGGRFQALSVRQLLDKMMSQTNLHAHMRSDRVRASTRSTCQHWEMLKLNGGMQSYAKIHCNLVTGLCVGSLKLKVRVAKCIFCKRVDNSVAACLHCIFFACGRNGHLKAHYKETGHAIVCNLLSGALYCFKCTDYIYEPDAMSLDGYNWRRMYQLRGIPYDPVLTGVSFADRFLQNGGTPGTCLVPHATFGMRGLVNLGHTCFMNCIIQALIHTPLLRDFFLSSKIDCKSHKHDKIQQKPCIITPLFELYQEFYNGSKHALSLHKLLPQIWDNASHLAGYEQQDAHEFFIAILDALHLHFSASFDGLPCNCIVDITFLGRLQSAVTCTICGHQSITVDPFWDTSLDIMSETANTSLELEEVLMRYTRVEYLGPGSMIQCADCACKTESTKQLHFQVLPIILCLHLKRFEHSNSTVCKKIDTCVRFPERLDLTPFTTLNPFSEEEPSPQKIKRRKSNGPNPNAPNELCERNANSRRYYNLYAVVNHVGSFEGGHYYAYVKHGPDLWFKCDDNIITRASRDEVLNSPGYLLFYHKTVLPYDDARYRDLIIE